MTCAFCRTTPINPCPMCSMNFTTTARPMRKAKVKTPRQVAGQALRASVRAFVAKQASTLVPPPIIAQRPAQAPRVAILSVCCDSCDSVFPASRPIPSGMVRLDSGRLVCEKCAAKKQAIVESDWARAARFTMRVLGKPLALVSQAGNQTMPPVSRGDWAGLAREVDEGRMTHDQAVALAGTWSRMGVAS